MKRHALTACALVLFGSASAQGADVLSDPLSGSTTGQQNGGSFVTGGGWQAGQQIKWDLGVELIDGGMSVEVTNWNPNSDSPQHQFDKQHIINLYQATHGSPHSSDGDTPKTDFFNIRTGASYDNLFKFLSSTSGFDPPPVGRLETRVKKALGFINPASTYTIKVVWTQTGDITASLDAESLVTHSHGTPFRLRHVFIGTDNAPPGTYGPQKDVIYKNLKVWGTTEGSGGTGGAGGAGGAGGTGGTGGGGGAATFSFEPVADTYTDPLNATTNHGANPELRAGGDGAGGLGRIIFLRFDVKGVGQVKSAKLYLKAMNAGGGGDIRTVADDSWIESAVTHQSKPQHDAQVLGTLGKVEIDGVYFFDVTSAVQGDGLHSFAITSADGDGCGCNSKENAGTHPELVIESAGAGGAGGTSAGGAGGATGGSGATSAGSGGATSGGGGGPSAGTGSSNGGSTTPADDEGGCGCRVKPSPSSALWALGLLALGALLGRRR